MIQFQYNLGSPNNVPERDLLQATECVLDLQRQQLDAVRRYRNGAEDIRESLTKQIHQLFGPSKAKKLAEFRISHRRKLLAAKRALQKAPYEEDKYHTKRRRLVEQSNRFLSEMDISADEVEAIFAKASQAEKKLFTRLIDTGIDATDETPPKTQRRKSRPKKKNTTFIPPYPGWWWEYYRYRNDFDIKVPYIYILAHETGIGRLKVDSKLLVPDADDYDISYARSRPAMAVWYQMPSTGQVGVWFKLESIQGSIYGHVYNEAGWSEVRVQQYIRTYARVVSPTYTNLVRWRHFGSWYYEWNTDTNEETHTWSVPNHTVPHKTAIMIIPHTFAAGTWVCVLAGIEQINHFFSDDCEVHSNMSHECLVSEVHVSSTVG